MDLDKTREKLENYFWKKWYSCKAKDDIFKLDEVILWYIELGGIIEKDSDIEKFINFLDNEQRKREMVSVKQRVVCNYLSNYVSSRDREILNFDAALLRNEKLTLDELRKILNRRYCSFIASEDYCQEEKIFFLQDFVALGGVLDDILDSKETIDLSAIVTLKQLLSMGCIEYIRYLSDVNKSEREDFRIR